MGAQQEPVEWNDLDKESQTQLLVDYGYYLEGLPPTCDLDEKNNRFVSWLKNKGVAYTV